MKKCEKCGKLIPKEEYENPGARKLRSGYMDVLKVVNGLSPSTPIDYIKHFIKNEKLPEEETSEAEKLIKKIPLVNRQSRNPRVLAGAVLYEIHKAENPRHRSIYTQRYIADQLQVTDVALRNNWIKFFKNT